MSIRRGLCAFAIFRSLISQSDMFGRSRLTALVMALGFVLCGSARASDVWGRALRPAGCCQTRYRIAKLAELRDKLRGAKDLYWEEIVTIQRQVAAAWVLHAEGKSERR